MDKGTTLLNVKELFGNFHDVIPTIEGRIGYESSWTWPEEIGNGFMSTIKLKNWLSLGLGNFQVAEKIAVIFDQMMPPVVLGFCVTSLRDYNFNYIAGQKNSGVIQSGFGLVSYQLERQGIMEYPGKMPIRFICIYIDPPTLKAFMDEQYDRFPTSLCDIVNGNHESSFHQPFMMTPAINMAIYQIFDCSYKGALKRFYFESKTLELITHAMAQLAVHGNGQNKNVIVQPNDIKYVWDAKDILLDNLDRPPSLLELARQVGSNKTTLSQGFRQVFGTSVFEYLRIHRLERARDLLESKKMNVTETAFEVGYEHPKNFARAFKNHFGTSPKDHL